MEEGLVWRKFLVEWPENIPRSGVIVTQIEQIPFVDFLLSESIGLFERRAPDTVGGRRVLVPYAKIEAIKIVEPIQVDVFLDLGFRGPKAAST